MRYIVRFLRIVVDFIIFGLACALAGFIVTSVTILVQRWYATPVELRSFRMLFNL